MSDATRDAIDRQFGETLALLEAVRAGDQAPLVKAIEVIGEALANGQGLLVFGNGGSAADAQHFAAEFVGRFARERRAVPALALTTDTSALTASACPTVMGARKGNIGLRAKSAAKTARNVTPQTATHSAATLAPTRRMSPHCNSVPATSAMRLTASPFTSSNPFTPALGMKPSA